MREGTNRLRIGALLLGVGLAFGVATPTFAQELPGITVDDDGETTIDTGELVLTADDPSTIEEAETRTTQEIFTADILDCIEDIGLDSSLEAVFENIGLDDEEVTEDDETPLNPVDEGSIVESRVNDCDADPL